MAISSDHNARSLVYQRVRADARTSADRWRCAAVTLAWVIGILTFVGCIVGGTIWHSRVGHSIKVGEYWSKGKLYDQYKWVALPGQQAAFNGSAVLVSVGAFVGAPLLGLSCLLIAVPSDNRFRKINEYQHLIMSRDNVAKLLTFSDDRLLMELLPHFSAEEMKDLRSLSEGRFRAIIYKCGQQTQNSQVIMGLSWDQSPKVLGEALAAVDRVALEKHPFSHALFQERLQGISFEKRLLVAKAYFDKTSVSPQERENTFTIGTENDRVTAVLSDEDARFAPPFNHEYRISRRLFEGRLSTEQQASLVQNKPVTLTLVQLLTLLKQDQPSLKPFLDFATFLSSTRTRSLSSKERVDFFRAAHQYCPDFYDRVLFQFVTKEENPD